MMIVLLFLVMTVVSATVNHVKMETMKSRDSFVLHSKPDSQLAHEVVFAVKQKNLDILDAKLTEMSTPGSDKYQQWMTFREVGEMTSNPTAAAAIRTWLTDSGVTVSWESAHRDYLKATASVEKWESLLSTTFNYWQDSSLQGHQEEMKLFIRAREYSVPDYLVEHIHAIFNTVQPPPVVSKAYYRTKDNKEVKTTLRMKDMMFNQQVTPSFLNSYYGITSNIGSALQNQSVFETSSEYYSPNDLTTFQQNYQTTVQKAIAVAGFTTNSCSLSGSPTDCFEGNLDIQYIMGISQITSSIYWYVGGNDPFVDWVTDVADEANPPQSNSISWGTIEQQNSVSTLSSFNTEAMKLASMGVTVMVSTGDNGVANFGCPCNSGRQTSSSNCACNANSGSSQADWSGSNTWSGTGYFPSFPATCPYVTAVGATMFPATSTRPEIACQSQLSGIITSGGGFSTYYAQPSWQTAPVSSYFSSLKTQPSSGYNRYGRGIPDVSLLGVNYNVIVRGTVVQLFGTSASAPVFAGMISLINAGRLARGLPNVGYINPTLYQYGVSATLKLFNDVTSGNNKCCSNNDPSGTATLCCNAGFNTTRGWDPVTGWGSVTFGNLTSMLNGAYLPTQQPTRAPTQYPTPSPLPSRVPTRGPTPLPGTPTLTPTVNYVVVVTVSQIITGTNLDAQQFNDNPNNAFTIQQSVQSSIANTESIVIISVANYVSVSRRRILTTSGIQLNYTVAVNNGGGMTSEQSYVSISDQITTAVDSGAFTIYMNTYAAANNATLLKSATSSEVFVDTAYAAPTASPVASPSSLSGGAIAGVVIGVFLFVGLVAGGCVYFVKRGSGSGNDTAKNKNATTESNTELPVASFKNPLNNANNSGKKPKSPPAPSAQAAVPIPPNKPPRNTRKNEDYI